MAIHEVVFKFPNTEGYPNISLEKEITPTQFDDQIVIPEKEISVFSDLVPHACFSGKEYKLVSSSDRGFSGFELAKKFQDFCLMGSSSPPPRGSSSTRTRRIPSSSLSDSREGDWQVSCSRVGLLKKLLPEGSNFAVRVN